MLDEIRSKITEPLKKEKIDVVDIYLEEENGEKDLVIVIDKLPYVDIETCVLATKIINPILDENDFIKDAYVLDVCSKGVEE